MQEYENDIQMCIVLCLYNKIDHTNNIRQKFNVMCTDVSHYRGQI